MCTRCGKRPPRPDRKTCESCARGLRDSAAALRARRIAAGRCVMCNRPAAGGQTRCAKCRRFLPCRRAMGATWRISTRLAARRTGRATGAPDAAPAPGIAGPSWLCRVCVARPGRLPDWAIVRNESRRPLPAGTARARERYRAAGLCFTCGRGRDRPDRRNCKRCRRRLADASARYRAAHPPDRDRLYADARERRRRYIGGGALSRVRAGP